MKRLTPTPKRRCSHTDKGVRIDSNNNIVVSPNASSPLEVGNSLLPLRRAVLKDLSSEPVEAMNNKIFVGGIGQVTSCLCAHKENTITF